MTIKPTATAVDSKTTLSQVDLQDKVKQARLIKQESDSTNIGSLLSSSDTVNFSSAGSALSELDPNQILQDRSSKIDKIKKQLADGTYNPSSQDIAQSLAQEISDEILSSGGLLGQGQN